MINNLKNKNRVQEMPKEQNKLDSIIEIAWLRLEKKKPRAEQNHEARKKRVQVIINQNQERAVRRIKE